MMLRQFAILTVGCLSLSLPAVAQAPVDRTANTDTATGPGRLAGRAGVKNFMEQRGEKDLPEAMAFFRVHCPKLAAAYDKMPEEKQKEFRPMILGRFYGSKMAGPDGSDLKIVKLRQMEVEDHLFDAKNRLMDAQEKNSPDVDALKTELRQAVADLVDSKMEERRLRIARLEKLLSEERADLEKDQGDKAEMVEKRYQEVLDAQRPDPMAAHRPRGDGKRPDVKHPDNKPK